MFTVRSIRGDWMRVVAKNAFPQKSTRGRIDALAECLKISRRSCYAYVAEERRVPEDIEARFIALFGEVAEDGWRTVDLYRVRTRRARKDKRRRREIAQGMTKERAAEIKKEWIDRAKDAARRLADDLLDHKIEWEVNPLTYGQAAMLEESLDEQEARRKHPNNFDLPAMADDVVAVCGSCGLIGAIDASVKEINGLVFRVTCRSNSYQVKE